MTNKKQTYVVILKAIILFYVLFCLVIAGLNSAVAPNADEHTAEFINNAWLFFENEFKVILVIICSILSIKILKKNKSSMLRVRNYTGLCISALVIHILAPIITGTRDIYFFAMPLPWSSLSLQVLNPSAPFHTRFIAHWGSSGLNLVLAFIIFVNLFIIIGTLLFGRRLQCSQVCLLNGFAGELFSEAYPVFGKKKPKAGKAVKIIFKIARVILFAAAVFFTIHAALAVAGVINYKNISLVYTIETFKYLSLELLMTMFFWIAFTARGYCYYCPAGTFLGLISKLAKQQIKTDLNKCIKCGKCNTACHMSIDVKSFAAEKKPVISMNCVGCGHCIDECPTETLQYSTWFLELLRSKRKKQKRVLEAV